MKKVVSFTIEWFGGYFIPEGEVCYDSTSVYREQRKIIYHATYKNEKIDEYEPAYLKYEKKDDIHEEFLISKRACSLIFHCIDDAEKEMMFDKEDYRLNVIDGDKWKMHVHYSDNTTKIIYGNVECPDFGEQLELYIIDAILNHNHIVEYQQEKGCRISQESRLPESESVVSVEPNLFLGYADPYLDEDDEEFSRRGSSYVIIG